MQFFSAAAVAAVIVGWGLMPAHAQNHNDNSQGIWIYSQAPTSYPASNTVARVAVANQTGPVDNSSYSVSEVLRYKGNGIHVKRSNLKPARRPAATKITRNSSTDNYISARVRPDFVQSSSEAVEVVRLSSSVIRREKHQPKQQVAQPIFSTRRILPSEEIGVEIKYSSAYIPVRKSAPRSPSAPVITTSVKYSEPKIQNPVVVTASQTPKPNQADEPKPISNYEFDWGVPIDQHQKPADVKHKIEILNEYKRNTSILDINNSSNINIIDNGNNITFEHNTVVLDRFFK